MSLTIRCDFCGKELAEDYRRSGVELHDERGFVAAAYDACDEDVALAVMLFQQRIGSRLDRSKNTPT